MQFAIACGKQQAHFEFLLRSVSNLHLQEGDDLEIIRNFFPLISAWNIINYDGMLRSVFYRDNELRYCACFIAV